ncbi:hypothetical protein F895_03154 [Acinetobacter sp. CIP 64.2]|uniref:Transporter n=1 Tax=Acinetobacter colistiniresistens TaxID=280145 RepID=A0A558EWC5_9GAMM|nr:MULTISPECIES: outer membrane protein transport protein [Acinetobacter]ENX12227.1 hypothetical protein F895_03154 [Acinetobacter sp. CIP 64.2]TVT77343.1 transporter [Acinetobacter colistiniresistens]
MVMNYRIKLVTLTLCLPVTSIFAAGLERTAQPISAFLQNHNYFEAGFSVVDPTISGRANNANGGGVISDMAESYYSVQMALKLQLNPHFSFGLIYDEPFGANVAFATSDPHRTDESGLFYSGRQNTKVEASAKNISFLAGYQPDENWNLFLGGAYQTFQTNIQVRGTAGGGTNALGHYNANLQEGGATGYIAGISYQIPRSASKATISYRSQITHQLATNEFGQSNILAIEDNNPEAAYFNERSKTKVITPQSVNLDLQTALAPQLIMLSSIRWVNWKQFSFRPAKFGDISEVLGKQGLAPDNPNGFDLLTYAKDQLSASIGLSYKMNQHWSANGSLLWDSGAGHPASSLGPTKGYWGAGLGVQYSPNNQYFIAGGMKYLKVGDADAQTASVFGTSKSIAKFENNHLLGYGLKIGYRF